MKKKLTEYKTIAQQYLDCEWIVESRPDGPKLTCSIARLCEIEIYVHAKGSEIMPAGARTIIRGYKGELDIKDWLTLEEGLLYVVDHIQTILNDIFGKLPVRGKTRPRAAMCDLGSIKFAVGLDGSGSGSIQILPKVVHDDVPESEPEDGCYTPEQVAAISYKAAFDAVESMVLAQACAGIDITTRAYADGIQTVLDAIQNNLE